MNAFDRIAFRPMGYDDLDRVMAIEAELYEFPWSRGNFGDSIGSGYLCEVMERGGFLAGYGVMMTVVDEAHLLNLSVARNWQGFGMGRRLLGHFMHSARESALRYFQLEVRISNAVARSLYLSAGFEEVAVRPGYYPVSGGREDAVIMGVAL